MKTLISIILVTLGILYVLSPYDLLPNFIPVIGWIDDIAVTGLMIYYFKYGRLPGFITRFLGGMTGHGRQQAGGGYHHADEGENHTRQQGGGSSSYARGSAKNPYEILGISPDASAQEIHSAYRKLVQQYHPDKVSHMGKEIQETAKRKFVEIQAAYESVKRR